MHSLLLYDAVQGFNKTHVIWRGEYGGVPGTFIALDSRGLSSSGWGLARYWVGLNFSQSSLTLPPHTECVACFTVWPVATLTYWNTKRYDVEITQHHLTIFSCDKYRKAWNMQEKFNWWVKMTGEWWHAIMYTWLRLVEIILLEKSTIGSNIQQPCEILDGEYQEMKLGVLYASWRY